jgi:hypothetical protein
LLDFSQFDAFSTNNVMLNDTQQSTAATEFEQILELGSVPTTGKLSNEDNINSNVMNNGPSPPFIAFQENMAKKTDSNSVTGKCCILCIKNMTHEMVMFWDIMPLQNIGNELTVATASYPRRV